MNTGDADNDGIDDACDPDDTVPGDGNGYASPAPGMFVDHDGFWYDEWTTGANEQYGAADVTASVHGYESFNSDDMGNPDAAPDFNGNGSPDRFSAEDTDGDGYTDGCETGLLLYGSAGSTGSDALDASSIPTGTAAITPGDCDNDGNMDGSYDEDPPLHAARLRPHTAGRDDEPAGLVHAGQRR